MPSGTCKNCGGDYGIHHYLTRQCPYGGREAPLNQKQEYMTMNFEAEEPKVKVTKDEITKQYLNSERSKSIYCFYYLDGYLVGLLAAKHISRDEYKEYRQWNEEALKMFQKGDNDE